MERSNLGNRRQVKMSLEKVKVKTMSPVKSRSPMINDNSRAPVGINSPKDLGIYSPGQRTP